MNTSTATPVVFPTLIERVVTRFVCVTMTIILVCAGVGAHFDLMPFDIGLLLTGVSLIVGGLAFDIWRRQIPAYLTWFGSMAAGGELRPVTELDTLYRSKLRFVIPLLAVAIAEGFAFTTFRHAWFVHLIAIAWAYVGGACSWALGATAVWVALSTRRGIGVQLRHPDGGGGLRPIGDFVSLMVTPLLVATATLGFATINPDLHASRMHTLCELNESLQLKVMNRVRYPGWCQRKLRDAVDQEVQSALHAKILKDCSPADAHSCVLELTQVELRQDKPRPNPFWSDQVAFYARLGFLFPALPLTLFVLWFPLRGLYALIASEKKRVLGAIESQLKTLESELNDLAIKGDLDLLKAKRERLDTLRSDWADCSAATWVVSRRSVLGVLLAQVPGLLGLLGPALLGWFS